MLAGLPGTSQETESTQTLRTAPAAGARPGTIQGTERMQTQRAAPAAGARHSAAVPSSMVLIYLYRKILKCPSLPNVF